MIDYENETTDKLSDLKDRMETELSMMPGGSRLDEARREDLSEEFAEVEYELNRREESPVTHVIACLGGCGKVYDLSDDPGVYVCHRCRMMSRV